MIAQLPLVGKGEIKKDQGSALCTNRASEEFVLQLMLGRVRRNKQNPTHAQGRRKNQR